MKLIKFSIFSLFCFFSINAFAFFPIIEDPTIVSAETIKNGADTLMRENHIPGLAILVYIDGYPYSYYFGYADRDKKKPVTQKTVFEVGSISKVMTSLLLAQEIDMAKMSLSDPIKKYIPDLSTAFDEMTLKELATHTSGLAFTAPEAIHTDVDLKKYLANFTFGNPNQQQETTSEAEWQYSNFGIGLLASALENSSHKTINELYYRRILSPLRMQPIGFTVPARFQINYAQGYDQDDKPVARSNNGLFKAAWDVKMSAQDMQHFLSAAIGLPGTPDRIFYPMRMTQSAYVKLPNKMQGLAWEIHTITPKHIKELLMEEDNLRSTKSVLEVFNQPMFSGDVLIDKTGGTNGFRSYIAVLPNKKSGIVILANKFIPGNAVVKVGREILFKLTHLSEKNAQVT